MQIRLTNPRWPTSIQYQAKTIRSYSKRRVVLLNGAIARDHIAHFSGVLCELGEQPCKGQMLPCEEIKIMQRIFELSGTSNPRAVGQSKTLPKPGVWRWIRSNPKTRYDAY